MLGVVIVSHLACSFPSAPTAPPAEEAPPAAAAPSSAPVDAFVVGQTTLRKAASDDRRVAEGSEQVSNWVATLSRGEKVTWLADDGDWSRVVLSDEKEGWLRSNRLVRAADGQTLRVATVLADGKLFIRPDLTALEADKTIRAGSLVFVLQQKDPFVEVDYPRSPVSSSRGWALASDLAYDPIEVEAAKVIGKVIELRAAQDEGAPKMEELARTQFATSKLLPLLDAPPPAQVEPPRPAVEAPTSP